VISFVLSHQKEERVHKKFAFFISFVVVLWLKNIDPPDEKKKIDVRNI